MEIACLSGRNFKVLRDFGHLHNVPSVEELPRLELLDKIARSCQGHRDRGAEDPHLRPCRGEVLLSITIQLPLSPDLLSERSQLPPLHRLQLPPHLTLGPVASGMAPVALVQPGEVVGISEGSHHISLTTPAVESSRLILTCPI